MNPQSPNPNELLPCPFCGSDAEIDLHGSFKHYRTGQTLSSIDITCSKCPVSIRMAYADFPDLTPEMVIGYWNTRTPIPDDLKKDRDNCILFLQSITNSGNLSKDEHKAASELLQTLQKG